jgi:hypothetical protein
VRWYVVVALVCVGAILCFLWWGKREHPRPMRGKTGDDSLANVLITLHRDPGGGAGPTYWLTIDGKGQVQYQGQSLVDTVGYRTAQIPVDSVKALIAEFYRMNYFSRSSGMGNPVFDAPTYETSIRIGPRYHEVVHQLVDVAQERDSLVLLENRIDDVAQSVRWIGQRSFRRIAGR